MTEICRHLDGLPLAIELAAAQVQAFSPADIAARLGDRFRLLQRPSPDFDRHRSLRATISWSHDLLSPGARIVLRRLAAFAGSFELSAAEEVCAGPELDRADIAPRLGELVGNSLVVRDASSRPERYRLLETVRVYADEQLDEAGERRLAGSAHAAWCLDLAETASPHIPGPDEVVWRRRLDVEVHELRAALAFDLGNQPEHGLRLAVALSRYWLMWDRADEGLQTLPALLLAASAESELRARALVAAAELGADHGEARQSSEWAEEALDLYHSNGDLYGAALARCALASAQQNRGNLERAARLLETCSEYFEAEERTGDMARAVYALSFVETQCGEYERAERAARRALLEWGRIESPCGQAKALWMLANIARYRGDLAAATALSEESLRGFADISDALSIVHVRMTIADVARLGGDNARAHDLYQQALPELQRIGDRRCTGSTLKNLASLGRRAGDYDAAVDLYCQSIEIRRDLGDEGGLAECMEGLAATCQILGNSDEAVTLLGGAHSLRENFGVAASLPERHEVAAELDALRARLEPAIFARAWEAGIKLRTDEAIDRCLHLGPSRHRSTTEQTR